MLNTGGREEEEARERREMSKKGEKSVNDIFLGYCDSGLIRRFSNESFESRFTSHLVKRNLSANKHRCVHPLDERGS